MNSANGVFSGNKQVKLRYFAALRDATGRSEEWTDLEVNTAGQLFDQLKIRYDFPFSADEVRVAINGAFAGHESTIRHNDEVVFIPPVSGG